MSGLTPAERERLHPGQAMSTGHYRYEHGSGRGLILEPNSDGGALLTIWLDDVAELWVDLPATCARELAEALLAGGER